MSLFRNVFLLSLALGSSQSLAQNCPSHIRFVHGHAFSDGAVDVRINSRTVARGLGFREVGAYRAVAPGKAQVEFISQKTGAVVGHKEIMLGAGQAYTAIVAGPAKGVQGLLFGNESPFIFIDDITPPMPGRWKGHWYRMSETDVVIDFRISNGADPKQEIYRLVQKPNRASYQLADLPAGVFQFNPVMPGSSDAFFNQALNPPAHVQLANVQIHGGETYDIFALGNFLGRTPNSLQLTSSRYRSEVAPNGCIYPTEVK